MAQDYNQDKLDKFLQLFNGFLEHANDTLGKPYHFGASVGYYMGVPDGNHKLENYLKIADERMYENKKIRKAKTHPGVGVR
jgi:GGDEF domain-containing protein